jgi:hypothetical protein
MERLGSVVHGLAPVNIGPLTAHTGGVRDSSRFHPVHVINNFNFNFSEFAFKFSKSPRNISSRSVLTEFWPYYIGDVFFSHIASDTTTNRIAPSSASLRKNSPEHADTVHRCAVRCVLGSSFVEIFALFEFARFFCRLHMSVQGGVREAISDGCGLSTKNGDMCIHKPIYPLRSENSIHKIYS